MQPQLFRFRQDVLSAARSRMRRRLLLSVGAAALAILALWGGILRRQGSTLGTLAFALILLGVLAALSLRKRLRRLDARWSSFGVHLDEEGISREVIGFPSIRIARADIAAVEERGAGLVVRGRAGQALLVPREVDGYERIRELLAAWRPASP